MIVCCPQVCNPWDPRNVIFIYHSLPLMRWTNCDEKFPNHGIVYFYYYVYYCYCYCYYYYYPHHHHHFITHWQAHVQNGGSLLPPMARELARPPVPRRDVTSRVHPGIILTGYSEISDKQNIFVRETTGHQPRLTFRHAYVG